MHDIMASIVFFIFWHFCLAILCFLAFVLAILSAYNALTQFIAPSYSANLISNVTSSESPSRTILFKEQILYYPVTLPCYSFTALITICNYPHFFPFLTFYHIFLLVEIKLLRKTFVCSVLCCIFSATYIWQTVSTQGMFLN